MAKRKLEVRVPITNGSTKFNFGPIHKTKVLKRMFEVKIVSIKLRDIIQMVKISLDVYTYFFPTIL